MESNRDRRKRPLVFPNYRIGTFSALLNNTDKSSHSASFDMHDSESSNEHLVDSGLYGDPVIHKINEIKEGTKIFHPKYGRGIVKCIYSYTAEHYVRVNFKSIGDKTLLLSFNPFIIED